MTEMHTNPPRSLGDLLGFGGSERAALDRLAALQDVTGRHVERVETLETLLVLDALDPSTWTRLAEAYCRTGDEVRSRLARQLATNLKERGSR